MEELTTGMLHDKEFTGIISTIEGKYLMVDGWLYFLNGNEVIVNHRNILVLEKLDLTDYKEDIVDAIIDINEAVSGDWELEGELTDEEIEEEGRMNLYEIYKEVGLEKLIPEEGRN